MKKYTAIISILFFNNLFSYQKWQYVLDRYLESKGYEVGSIAGKKLVYGRHPILKRHNEDFDYVGINHVRLAYERSMGKDWCGAALPTIKEILNTSNRQLFELR